MIMIPVLAAMLQPLPFTFLQASCAGVVFSFMGSSFAFQLLLLPALHHHHHHVPLTKHLAAKDYQEDEDAVPDVDTNNWRAFRAQLVSENQNDSSGVNLSSSWAYDAGQMIEKGSIILARVEPDFCYFGLNQQYFHKSVMLVTYHKENEFTKGIILNRPTNLFLDDEDFLDDEGEPYFMDENKNFTGTDTNSWRIWFGGDVRGLYTDDSEGGTEIVCLHSINTELARNFSEEIMTNLFTTNYEGARKIIGQPSNIQ
jgi:hypothetical protein